MIEAAVVARLLNTPAVTVLVGDRVIPAPLDQGLKFGVDGEPVAAISYQRISLVTSRTMEGLAGPHRPRIQVDCWGRGYMTVKALAEAVRVALEGWREPEGANEEIRGSFLDGQRDMYESDVKLHRVSSDFKIWAAAAA